MTPARTPAEPDARAEDLAGNGLLKISELSERSGVPVATIRHYLREGLLPEPVKTSRNMAYYAPEFVDRIRLIKQLQEERFMPLRVIRELLDQERVPAKEVAERHGVPHEVLDRLAELEILSPTEEGYSPTDVRIIEAISRFRAGGYDESLGFTVYDTLRYKRALEPLVAEEIQVLSERLGGDVDPQRAVQIVEAGIGPLNDLIAALHTKLMVTSVEDTAGR